MRVPMLLLLVVVVAIAAVVLLLAFSPVFPLPSLPADIQFCS
jgi:hypothetical protein